MSEEVKDIESSEVIETESREVSKFNWSVSQNGEIEARNLSEVSSAISAYRKAGLIPTQFKTNEIAMGAYLYCKNLSLDPLITWGQVTNINGKFAPFGSLFSALAQRDPDYRSDGGRFEVNKEGSIREQ